jgi:N-acetylmuramoyl-L-alanine amidase
MHKFIEVLKKIFEVWSKHRESRLTIQLPAISGRSVNWIVMHHSLTEDTRVKNWEAIRKYHKEHNGWDDIGYHYGIDYIEEKPTLLEGRSLTKMGAHTKGLNRESIGICIVGNYDKVQPPEDKWELALKLVRTLMQEYGIPKENVIGHGEAQEMLHDSYRKTCPGKRFNMNKFRWEI